MNENEVKEIKAMMIVLFKRVCELEKEKTGHHRGARTSQQWLEELKQEAEKLKY